MFKSKPAVEAKNLIRRGVSKVIGRGDFGEVRCEGFVFANRYGGEPRSKNLVVKKMKIPEAAGGDWGPPDELELAKRRIKLSERIDYLVELHAFCKSVGLPVPTTFRRLGMGEVLMTDLTENGNYYVESTNNSPEEKVVPLESISNFENLLDQFVSILNICIENKVNLNDDAFFYKWPKGGGDVQLLLADFDRVRIHESARYPYDPKRSAGEFYVSFHRFLMKFLGEDADFLGYLGGFQKRFAELGFVKPF